MNRLFVRIIMGLLIAYFAATILLHVFTTLFWGRIFTDPTYYPLKHTAELLQLIIENTPRDKVIQEVEYLSNVLERPIDLVPADDIVIPEAVRQKLLGGRIIFDKSKNGKKKFFAPVNNNRQVVVIDPSFQQYRPPVRILISIPPYTMAVMMAILAGFILAKPLTRRLESLKFAAIKIRHGDVTARVRNDSDDLMGNVEKCFNQMADRIQTLVATRRNFLNNILQKFKAPIVQIDECIKQWRSDIVTSQKKTQLKKINFMIKDITHLVNNLLRLEKNRQCESISTNKASATSENPYNSMGSANQSMLKAGIIKFIIRISAGIFIALIANQFLILIVPQILTKYIDVNPSWYAVHTMSTLIQRSVDITPQEELPARLELLRKILEKKLDLVPTVEAERLFIRTLEREFTGGITYGVFDGKKMFRAPIHSGAYSLMIETASHLYRRKTSLFYHAMILIGWFVLTLFFGILLSMPIIRNVKKLLEGIERLRMEDFDARVNIPLNKPIGILASHFNSMADHIQLLIENQRHLVQAVVHEIRTPLSRIQFHLEMLMDSEDRKEMNRDAKDIEVEIKELRLLLKELSTFMKFDAMTCKLELEDISLRNTLLEIVNYFQKASHDIRIMLHSDKKENIYIRVHPIYFKMAIRNIVSNAIRYAQQNVSISYGFEKDEIFVIICDDGPGIPDHVKKIVLEPFTRLDNSRNRESGGFGLGLAIVSRIIQLHNGSIEILDNFSQGVEVITYWPTSHPC